jgi:hypothetical protein
MFLVESDSSLRPLLPVNVFRPAPMNAFLVAPVVVQIPGLPFEAQGVMVRMRVWKGSDTYETAPIRGESNDITLRPLGGIPILHVGNPPDLGGAAPGQGLQSFTVEAVPEPSTLALVIAGLIVASLAHSSTFRRAGDATRDNLFQSPLLALPERNQSS